MNISNFKIKFSDRKQNYALFGLIVTVALCVGFFTWGKMQMGDSSVELTYGTMVKSGRVPYVDFYMHIMPLTSYVASFLLLAKLPIHAANILGALNIFAASLIVFASAHVLKLSFREKVLSLLLFFGVYTTTLPSFNHHSFDVTLSACVAFCLIGLIRAVSKKEIYIWAGVVAVCSVANFFVTQTYGMASMALGLFVLFADYVLNKNKLSIRKLFVLVSAQLLCLFIFLGSFVMFGKISLQKMYESTFATGYQQYTGTYGYGTIWRTSITNVRSLYYKRFAPAKDVVQQSNTAVEFGQEPDLLPEGLFYKVFLKKSSLLFSVFSLFGLFFIIYMAIYIVYIFLKKIRYKEPIEPVFLLWTGMVGIFFASSILVFQMNFSVFFMIFVLWLFNVKQEMNGKFLFFNNVFNVVAGGLVALLFVSNFTILYFDFKTRDYFLSKTKNENVWVPMSYYKSFSAQFRDLSLFLDAGQEAGSLAAYPRASEIYYLLGKIPPAGFPLVSFYRPGGAYGATLDGAENSKIVIIFEPKFYGSDLGEEHAFAMKQIQPALDKNFTLSFSSAYFKIYKHL